MSPSTGPGVRLSRRELLRGMAAFTTASPGRPSASSPDLSVLTWNFYLGVNLFRLQRATTPNEVRRVAGQLLASATRHPYTNRAGAIADEVAASRPSIVAVQEVVLLRTRESGAEDPDSNPSPAATIVDALELLETALDERGVPYEVAAVTPTNEVEVPADTEEGTFDLLLTDRDVVLVREDVDIERVRSGMFDANQLVLLAGETQAIERGYSIVDIVVEEVPVTVATTHLESTSAAVRRQQARELLDRLPQDRPVVLAGDFNSGPKTNVETYAILTRSFEDVETTSPADQAAPTCCQPPHLQNEESQLTERVDSVLYRGRLRPTATERVGLDPEDRISYSTGNRTGELWPSDHAGVLATLELHATTPTSTATSTRTSSTLTGTPSPTRTSGPTPAPDPTNQRTPSAPMGGFGFLAPLGAVLVAIGAGLRSWLDS